MPVFSIDDEPGMDDTSINMLDEVSLQSFTASPVNIAPFGASHLSWSVTAPNAVRIRLNGATVSKTGHQVVMPSMTTSYRLSAHFGQASKSLGSLQVAVDRASCETIVLINPRASIESVIRTSINNPSNDLYFRGIIPLILTFAPGRIRLRLFLGLSLNNRPNPHISLDVSFGLTVRNGKLEAIDQEVDAEVSVASWARALGGFALALVLAVAKDQALKSARELVQTVVAILNAATLIPEGKRLSTVRVDDGNNGNGVIEITVCDHRMLIRLAEISEAVILT